MITAAEARERAKLSDADVDRHMENIGKAIEAQADIGKRQMFLSNAKPYDSEYEVAEPLAFRTVEFTPLQKRLQEKLKTLGFGMRIESEKYDRNKTPGLGWCGDRDEEDIQTRYWITVSW